MLVFQGDGNFRISRDRELGDFERVLKDKIVTFIGEERRC